MTSFARALLCLACLAACAAPALADVVHLKNGRTMEGEVIRRTARSLELQVKDGTLTLPLSMIERVEQRATPQDEYANRARRVDMSDPGQVERLALWASRRGLGQEASDLNALAQGLRLEQKVEAIRDHGSAEDWLNVYAWAQHRDVSQEVLEWLLSKAEELGPDHPAVVQARQDRDRELARQEAEAASQEAELTPAERRGQVIAARQAREQDAEEADRIAQLEDRLQQQQARIDELEQRRETRFRFRRRRNDDRGHGRRRGRGGSIGVIGPIVQPGCQPGVQIPSLPLLRATPVAPPPTAGSSCQPQGQPQTQGPRLQMSR